jgi:hypothetical protein
MDEPGDEQRRNEAGDQQRRIETPNVDVPPPPPRQRSGLGRGAWIAIGGCIGLLGLALLLVVEVGGCLAFLASTGGERDSKSGGSKEDAPRAAIGESLTVGDAVWRVSEAR